MTGQALRRPARRRAGPAPATERTSMDALLYIGIALFIIAIIAYVLGAKGVAGMSASLGKTLLIIFLILAVILIVIRLIA